MGKRYFDIESLAALDVGAVVTLTTPAPPAAD
jgi:hypothetical protein